jgi:hypothetical protein
MVEREKILTKSNSQIEFALNTTNNFLKIIIEKNKKPLGVEEKLKK